MTQRQSTNLMIHYNALADKAYLESLYKRLLDGLGIGNSMVDHPSPGPAHPIEEENERLTRQFMENMQTLKGLQIAKMDVRLDKCRVADNHMVMMFSYLEPTSS